MFSKGFSFKFAAFVLILFVLTNISLANKIIYVDDDAPADFESIQAAIDDANDGDTVFVAEGTYYENIKMKNGITLIGAGAERTTIIGNYGHVVIFNNVSGKIAGFKITRSFNNPSFGDGIFTSQCNVTIENNIIENNLNGIKVYNNSFAVITGNKIINSKGIFGYGIDLFLSNAIIKNNVISGSSYGGINCSDSPQIISNNTIFDNGHHGIICVPHPNDVITNNIIENNEYGIMIQGDYKSHLFKISYNNVWNNSESNYWVSWSISCFPEDPNCIPQGANESFEPQPGTGEISIDPLFADPNNGDYHLKSQAGRFDPNTQTWVKDEVTSPCIDAGDPNSPIGLEPFPNGGRINMGAYGGTSEASKSYFGKPVCQTIVAGDINGDCKVDVLDFEIMLLHWLEEH